MEWIKYEKLRSLTDLAQKPVPLRETHFQCLTIIASIDSLNNEGRKRENRFGGSILGLDYTEYVIVLRIL
jgi:hypothetical protein